MQTLLSVTFYEPAFVQESTSLCHHNPDEIVDSLVLHGMYQLRVSGI